MIRGSNLESSSNLSLNDFKVEESLKGSLDSILSPSPSVQIQIMGGKVCLRRKGKTLLGIVNKLFICKNCLVFVDNIQHCFDFTLFPPLI